MLSEDLLNEPKDLDNKMDKLGGNLPIWWVKVEKNLILF